MLPFGRASWKTSIGPQNPPGLKEEKRALPRLFLCWLQGLKGILLFTSLFWTQSRVSGLSSSAWQCIWVDFLFSLTSPLISGFFFSTFSVTSLMSCRWHIVFRGKKKYFRIWFLEIIFWNTHINTAGVNHCLSEILTSESKRSTENPFFLWQWTFIAGYFSEIVLLYFFTFKIKMEYEETLVQQPTQLHWEQACVLWPFRTLTVYSCFLELSGKTLPQEKD